MNLGAVFFVGNLTCSFHMLHTWPTQIYVGPPTSTFLATLVAHIDDGICLDVVHVRVSQAQLFAPSLGGADDACGHCVLKGERTADSDHKLAWPQISWPAQHQHWEFHLQYEIQYSIQILTPLSQATIHPLIQIIL